MRTCFLLILLASQSTVAGMQAPIASLVSLGPVRFNGVRLSAETVYFWPVMPDDDVWTQSTTATVLLPDKSRITLDRATHIKFSRRDGNTVLTLLEGQLGWSFAPGSPLRLATAAGLIDSMERSGTLAVQSGKVTMVRGRSTLASAPDPPPRPLPSLGMYLPVR